MTEYELIRSNRKTLTIQVKPDGSVIVRAPVRLAKYRIAKFVKDHETWILAQQEKLEKYRENMHVITDEERQEGILQAKKLFPERKEMNHSPRFWAVVEKELPDYRERREKLKKLGKQLG